MNKKLVSNVDNHIPIDIIFYSFAKRKQLKF